MKHKAFTEIVAHSTQVPEQTVALFTRNLKSAGLLTSGARGVNAPEMTEMDLARLLIALCATDRPKDAVAEAEWYRSLPCFEGGKITLPKYRNGSPTEEMVDLFEVSEGDKLEDVLSFVFGAPPIITTLLHMTFEIVLPNRVALLTLGDCPLRFNNVDFLKEMQRDGGDVLGIKTRRGLTTSALTEMALPFGLERADGGTWEDMVSGGRVASVAARHIFGAGK